jgi:hypothetical protein
VSVTVNPGHRVLLVREWDQQVGGSGCCGRLNSSSVEALCDIADSPYARSRVDMEAMGRIYTALRERFTPDEVEVTVVDPRNSVWLLPAIWRDGRRRGLPAMARLRQLSRGTAPCTVICDGLAVAQDATPEQAVAAVETDLSSRV